MAASEDEAELIVGDGRLVLRFLDGLDLHDEILPGRVEAGAAAEPVDCLEASGRNQPGHRIGRDAVARPLLGGRGEGVVQALLGEIEAAQQADQRRQHAPTLGAVNGADLALAGGRLRHVRFRTARSS